MRNFEGSLRDLFASVLLLHDFPRSLTRLNVQLTNADNDSSGLYAGSHNQGPSSRKLDGFTRGPTLRSSHKALCINAAAVALLDSGIPARATVVATSVSLARPSGASTTDRLALVANPSSAQEAAAEAHWLLAFACYGLNSGVQSGDNAAQMELILCEAPQAFAHHMVSAIVMRNVRTAKTDPFFSAR